MPRVVPVAAPLGVVHKAHATKTLANVTAYLLLMGQDVHFQNVPVLHATFVNSKTNAFKIVVRGVRLTTSVNRILQVLQTIKNKTNKILTIMHQRKQMVKHV